VDFLTKPIEPDVLRSKAGVFFELGCQRQEVARLLAESRQLTEALWQADRHKDEFLATLAHELRNPLAPLRNGLEILKMTAAGPAADKAREMMDRQLGHMVRLVDDLLDISRLSQGKLELRRKRVELRTVVESGVETSRPLIDAGRHQLTVSLPDEPVWLDADPTRVAQMIGNILTNAAKYTPNGGRIELTARREKGDAVVLVTDNGLGIPAEMQGKVFDMFSQVNRTIDRSQGGLGIGLSLVKRLTEMHGGTITVESPGPGLGSTFTIRMPSAAGLG
jgi:signal transduction histidine kinase